MARIDEAYGEVVVIEPAQSHGVPAAISQLLRVGNRLETGKDGHAKLSLRTGGSLTIDPNSIVLLQRAEDGPIEGEQETALLLEQGQVVGTGAKLETSAMVIEVGGQRIRIGRAAEARVTVPIEDDQLPRMLMVLGSATVVDTAGKRREIVRGELLEIGGVDVAPRVDAGRLLQRVDAGTRADLKAAAPPTIVEAKDLVYRIQLKRGSASIKGPREDRFHRIAQRRAVPVYLGSEIKLGEQTVATVQTDRGELLEFRGPARLVVREGKDRNDVRPTLEFETQSADQVILLQGKRGDKGPPYIVQGVRMSTAVTHRTLNVRIRQEQKRAIVNVKSGEVRLIDKRGHIARVEAGQQAVLSGGQIAETNSPNEAALVIDKPGSLRVFVASQTVPVTLGWTRPAGSIGAFVEVGTSPFFEQVLFADVIERNRLTIEVPRRTVYWRVRPVGPSGQLQQATEGRLAFMRDTSFLALKDAKPPRNLIQESFGNTTVFYQNALPRFTFSWNAISGASRYTFKLFREGMLAEPLRVDESKESSVTLPSGGVGEGSYLWYVAARNSAGELLQATKSHGLKVVYDNATPNLQIIYPQSGLVVSDGSIEVRGAVIPGSKVFINGKAVRLDDTYRFAHSVSLRMGANDIVFRVMDKRNSSTLYLRRIVRR